MDEQRRESTDGPVAGRTGWPTVPGHELVGVVGRGGFATVYEARQLSVDRPVAVKVMTVGMLTEATERRFRDELRTVGALSWHPHVVGVHDGGLTAEGLPFISMELVTGGSWGDAVRRSGPLRPDLVAQLGAQVADALHAAHQAGIVHRDVKPDNILVGRRHDALLTDFGIATLADAGTNTATGVFVGTIGYSAPEVLRGQRASPRSDVYALGATLRTLATGRPPYETRTDVTPAAELLRVVHEPPEPLPPSVPPELAAIIGRAMARDEADRFASAADLQAALAALTGAPPPPPPPPPPPGPATLPPSHPVPGTGWAAAHAVPGTARAPVSGLAIGGLVAALLCCPPVGLGLTIGGHVQVRRGTRRGRGLVIAGYVAAAVMAALLVALTAIGLADLRDTTDDYTGTWRSTSEVDPVTLDLRSEAWGTSLGGSFEARRDGVACRGEVVERSRPANHVELELRGRCDDGSAYRRPLSLGAGSDGLLHSEQGLTFRRAR